MWALALIFTSLSKNETVSSPHCVRCRARLFCVLGSSLRMAENAVYALPSWTSYSKFAMEKTGKEHEFSKRPVLIAKFILIHETRRTLLPQPYKPSSQAVVERQRGRGILVPVRAEWSLLKLCRAQPKMQGMKSEPKPKRH